MTDFENIFLFEGLSDTEKKEITALLPEAKVYEKGETIYSKTDFCRSFCILLEGKATVKSGDVVYKEFCAGDTFGAAALFGKTEKYATDIYAASRCKVAFIGEDLLKSIFAKYPQCAINYIAFLSEKVRFLNRKIEQFSAASATEKLYLYLAEQGDKKINFSAAARFTGLGRTSLYRSLAELENSGRIERNGNIIKVISK